VDKTMKIAKKLRAMAVSVAAVGLLLAAPAGGEAAGPSAQAPGQRAQGAPRGMGGQRQQGLPPAEVERLFDGYVAMQAQDALKLTDAQLPQFLAKLKVLQATRRRHAQERRLLVAQLNSALREPSPSDETLRELLRQDRDLAAKAAQDVQKAYDAIDQVLELGQQARFRVFEEQVERRKFDLVLRARRTAQQGRSR
jgi:hypothetical protein